jgi:acetyl-CoA acetyltransferase
MKYDHADQDEFLRSHQRASAAVESGASIPKLSRCRSRRYSRNGVLEKTSVFKRMKVPCRHQPGGFPVETSLQEGGTVTAGNSSQMSDGAAGVIIMSHGADR